MFDPPENGFDNTPMGCIFTLLMGGWAALCLMTEDQNIPALLFGEAILMGIYYYLNKD